MPYNFLFFCKIIIDYFNFLHYLCILNEISLESLESL